MAEDIVIVDDDPDAREILKLVLGTLEVPIRQATDGIEALDLILQDPPLLIMLDLAMPRLDGRGVLAALQSNPKTANIPVLVFTADTVGEDKARELSLPSSRLLRKGGLSMTQLREAVIRDIKESISLDLAHL